MVVVVVAVQSFLGLVVVMAGTIGGAAVVLLQETKRRCAATALGVWMAFGNSLGGCLEDGRARWWDWFRVSF